MTNILVKILNRSGFILKKTFPPYCMYPVCWLIALSKIFELSLDMPSQVMGVDSVVTAKHMM